MIYSPEEDSFLLAEFVKKFSPKKDVLDVGCGSGIQMVAALNAGAKSCFGLDIDDECVEHCKKKGLNVLKSDLFSALTNEKFDLIVFNPPYLPRDEREDEESARATSGGKKGDEILVKFFDKVGKHLEKDGKILILISSLTPKERILKTLSSRGLKKRVLDMKKLFMEELEVWEVKSKT